MPDELSSQLASLKINRQTDSSSGGALRWLVGLIALVGVGAAIYLYALPRLEGQIFKTAVSFTQISSVSPAQASVELTSAGYVVPQRVSKLAPKVAGRVVNVNVKQGEHVEAGQVLLTLDPADDHAGLAAARSRVKAAWARTQSALADAATAKAELAEGQLLAARQQRLAGEGVTASGVAEDLMARVTSLQRRAQAAASGAEAAAAEARAQASDVTVLETRLDNLTLRAPIAGTVVTRPPQVGEMISPQPPGVSVDMGGMQIADFDSLMVETDVPEQRLSKVKVGTPAEIVLDAFPSRRFRGKTAEITPEVNRSKATVIVRVAFVDGKQGILPDMAARVSFLDRELDSKTISEPPKIIVPASAIAERGGGKVVFVVEDDTVRMTPVELGPAFGRGFELLKGPRTGTRLVAEPLDTLADGQRIKEKESQ
jgi:RND family efflux transporter MFP subunit